MLYVICYTLYYITCYTLTSSLEAVVSRKLREIFDRCDAQGRGRASRRDLIRSCQGNPWLAGFFRLPREGPVPSLSGNGSDREITFQEFYDHCARWAPTKPRAASPQPASRSPRARSQPAGPQPAWARADPQPTDEAMLERLFGAWGERQTAQHRHTRAWLVSRAVSGAVFGLGDPPVAGAVAQQAPSRTNYDD